MLTTKKDLSCTVAFAIKSLPSESCLTLSKWNMTLLGFRRIQIPLECEEPCEKRILPPHSADHTFFQVCAKLLNSIEFSLWGGHWSNVWIGWFDMVRLDCDGHSAAKPRPGLQPIPCWTGVAVCGPASRPHCPQWQEDLPESSWLWQCMEH